MFNYPIAISLSPNTQRDDVWQALKILIQPWRWQKEKEIKIVEEWFNKYFRTEKATSFNSGRSALYAILKIFGLGKGDKVILQSFTCVAVPDPIIWVGAEPVFVDIDELLNLDPEAIEKHIDTKTKAIIVQHTFGIPAKIELIKKIAQKHNLLLIEDCAHVLGASSDGKKLGTFGDAAFFSFGRDKVISSVFGGMAIISAKYKMQSEKLRDFQEQLSYPNYFWIFQQLIHPIAFAVILPLYNLVIGKIILFVLLKLRLLSKPVYEIEKSGRKPEIFPKKFPNALASLLLRQLEKLERYNQDRRQKARYYFKEFSSNSKIKLPVNNQEAIYLRFNILVNNSSEILKKAREKGILLGNWYKQVIDPHGVQYEKIGYKKGSCPKSEQIAHLSVNLPTYPRLKLTDIDLIIDMILK